MLLVNYTVCVCAEDGGDTQGSFECARQPCTLQDIVETFPFQGHFHFRARVPGDGSPASPSYVWLDLTTPEDAVPTQEQAGSRGSQHVVDLRALLVDDSLPCLLKPTASNQPGDSHRSDAVLAAMQHEYAARSVKRQRLDGPVDISRFPLDGGAAVASGAGGGAGGGAGAGAGSFWDASDPDDELAQQWRRASVAAEAVAAKATAAAAVASAAAASGAKQGMKKVMSVSRGVGRFFRSATKAASSYLKEVSAAAVAAPPDASVVMNLQSIAMDLSSPFEPTHPPHEALLARLWVAAYGGTPGDIVRVSPKWKRLGFQQQDPATDFRGGGVLGLKCLLYYAEKHTEHFRKVVEEQSPRLRQHYPVGAAGINVTMMLLAVLGLDKGPASASTEALSARKETYWPVFADYDGFYDVYCLAFQLFQFHWVLRDANYMQFGAVLAAARAALEGLLARGLPTAALLVQAAADEGWVPAPSDKT